VSQSIKRVLVVKKGHNFGSVTQILACLPTLNFSCTVIYVCII
jgi:hypothetical protein